MGSFLEKLYHYHQLTYRLHVLGQQIDSQRRRTHIQEMKLADHARQMDELREKIRRAQSAAGEAELELKTREAMLEKLRVQLNTTKTNKEYSALLREINTFKADSNRIEEEGLTRLAVVDDLKAALAKLQQQADLERRRLGELAGQAEGRERDLAAQVEALERQRSEAAAGLPGDVLAQMRRLADAHDGEAMAPLHRPHPKRDDYICGGCNMAVTLEQVIALSSRDEVITCHCCGRVLYLDESAQVARD